MARTHTMTPKRRAALKKAQMASARKRRGKGKGKLAAANRRIDSGNRRRRILGAASVAVGYGMLGYAAYLQHKDNKKTAMRRAALKADFRSTGKPKVYYDKSLGAYYTRKKK